MVDQIGSYIYSPSPCLSPEAVERYSPSPFQREKVGMRVIINETVV